MAFADYRQVASLPLERQRELLAAGDPMERVWAAWSLALTSASTAARDLRAVVGVEPSAGVRRHAATVLAGLGDRASLASLASLDPDPAVRASTCRLLARTSPADELGSWDLLTRALAQGSREVVLATLDGLTAASPPCAWDACRRLLQAEELELRTAALDAAMQRGFAAAGFPAELEAMALRERDPGLRCRLLTRWLEIAGPDAVARGLADADERTVLHFLELVRGRRPAPTWPALLPLAGRQDPEIDERLAAFACAPLGWLMEVVQRHYDKLPPDGPAAPRHPLQRAAESCVSRLEEELPRAGAEGLGEQTLSIARSLHQAVSRAIHESTALEQQLLDEGEEDPDPWGDDPPFIVGESLLPELERLIVRPVH